MSVLRPSSAARRVACPGSFTLESSLPKETDTSHTLEGEAAHWVASQMIMGGSTIPEINTFAPNGEPITVEMIDGAQLYLETIESNIIPGNLIHVEEHIKIPSIHPDCAGTPDAWAHDSKQLYLWDYKYGFKYVDVFENWQLIEYAAGILDLLKKPITVVNFFIVQPRSFHREGPVRKWSISVTELEFYFDKLRKAENAATQPHALCLPSPECNFCPARANCESLQRSALTACDVSVENTALTLTPQAVGIELWYLKRAAKLLDARITGLEQQADSLIRAGKAIPFFRLESGQGREVWKDLTKVLVMADMMDIELRKPVDLITPKQAIKKGLPEKIVRTYSEVSNTEMKLTQTSDATVSKIFNTTGENYVN